MRFSRLASLTLVTIGICFWTLAPYGGCSCNNTMGPSGIGPASGPTPTFTPTHGPVVDDFNAAGPNDSASTWVNHWKGVSEKSVDTFGTSTYNADFQPGADGGPALHFFGVFGSTVAPGGQAPPTCRSPGYPFVAHRMYLNPGGNGAEEDVTISVPGGATGLKFMAKRGSAVNGLVVKGILKTLSDYAIANPCNANAYHYHAATVPLGTGWTQITLPFSNFSWGGSWGADAKSAYGGTTLNSPMCRQGGGDLYLMALQFEPQNPSSFPGSAAYEFFIDDLEFY